VRYVDKNRLAMPTGWLARARAAAADVATGGDPNDHSQVWRALKDGLADLLHDKCWYCESPVDRSDNAVDHFRPKGRVSDARHLHNGYRWLAFETDNFRYACTFCNSRRKDVANGTAGGKQDRFPLLDESARVYTPGPVNAETPALLDPCDIDDWKLIACHQENGQPCPTSVDPTEKKRAEVSIEVYHLDYEPTCKRRHREAVQLLADIDEGKWLFEQVNTDPSKRQEFKKVAARLHKAIQKDAPFSGDMHFLLRSQRSANHPWVQDLLEM